MSQLLRNYSGLEILKDVQAEDTEDVTNRYVLMFEVEQDSDVIKRIRLKGNEKTFFDLLIEHKSRMDNNKMPERRKSHKISILNTIRLIKEK